MDMSMDISMDISGYIHGYTGLPKFRNFPGLPKFWDFPPRDAHVPKLFHSGLSEFQNLPRLPKFRILRPHPPPHDDTLHNYVLEFKSCKSVLEMHRVWGLGSNHAPKESIHSQACGSGGQGNPGTIGPSRSRSVQVLA